MTANPEPVIIKKYANRRLYNTGTSKYVTLNDLAEMVKAGEDFEVQDAKTNEDLTRSVLTQIIFEQEAKDGQSLLPVSFLRQLISYYGDSMQPMVPSFLEHTMNSFVAEQEKLREQMVGAFGKMGVPGFPDMESQVRQNMEMFQNAMGMFMPFATSMTGSTPATVKESRDDKDKAENDKGNGDEPKKEASSQDAQLDELKQQIAEMQKKLNSLT